MTTARTGTLGVVGASMLFGTSGTAAALLAPSAFPPSLAAVRLLVGAAGLVAFVLLLRRGPALLALWRLPSVWVMGLGVAGYQGLFFIGLARTGVATGTLVSLGIAPLAAGLLGWALREGAPGLAWLAATAVALGGLAMLTLGGGATVDALGVLAALGAGLCYALYTVLGARLARAGHDSSVVMAAPFSVGALLLVPMLAAAAWIASPSGIALALWLGLGATSLAYLLFGLGLRVLQPGHIATLTLAEPVVATALGVLVLGETLSATGWLGCVLILIGLAVVGSIGTRPAPVLAGGVR